MNQDIDINDVAAARAWVRQVVARFVRGEDTEDVAQEAMLLVHRHRDQFKGESKYSSWLYQVASRAAIDHVRSRGAARRSDHARVDADLEQQVSPTDVHAQLFAASELARARAAVEALGEKYPEVFWRRFGEGQTETEVARELGLSVAAVKARAHRGRLAALAALEAA